MRVSAARRSASPGYALVELLVTITVLTILLTLCAGLIKILLKLDGGGRDAMATSTDLARLARTFRDDAHQATAPPAIAGDHLTLSGPGDQNVEYTIRSTDILREVHRGAKVRQREFYRRLPHSTARFEATTEAGRPLLSIIIQRRATSDRNEASINDQIDAEVGRVGRLIVRQP